MDTQTTPFRHVPPPGTWRGQALLASGFHPGQASLSLEAKGNRVKTLSSSPVWILGSGRPLKTIRLPGPLGLRP